MQKRMIPDEELEKIAKEYSLSLEYIYGFLDGMEFVENEENGDAN